VSDHDPADAADRVEPQARVEEVTPESLRALWAERDRRYTYGLRPLSFSQINAVIEWRLSEARDVEGPDRNLLLGQAAVWEPPRRHSRVIL
jgi:hypothetical protein